MTANNHRIKFVFSLILFAWVVPICLGISREEALAPNFNQIMQSYEALPADYQPVHIQELESYLALFTTTNDVAWNAEWGDFIKRMGPEFTPCHPAVIEAMVIAETYQACYPSPESRISNIASILFSEIPTNAIVFIHHDVFESILRIEQQDSGLRNDVIVINSARIMDASYMKIVADRYPSLAGLGPSAFSTVFAEAKKQNTAGNKEFESLQVINGIVTMNGYDIICSSALLMAKEISKSNPTRPALIMPAVRDFWKPVPAWDSLTPIGLFCCWDGTMTAKSPLEVIASWTRFIDAVAPLNQPLQVRLSNATGKTINAAGFVHKDNGDDRTASALFQLCGNRMKRLRMVPGEAIRIDKNGQMVETEQ